MSIAPHDLRRMRIEANLRQKDLAEILKITAQHVGHIERGRRRVSLGHLKRWCEACGYELAAVGPGHGEATKVVERLDSVDAELLARIGTVLPTLEPAHRITLIGMLEIWERWSSTLDSQEEQGARQDKSEAG